MVSKKISVTLLVGITVLMIMIGLLLNPIPQPQAYHNFADQRSWFGMPNSWNVLSNIPFALAGIWGLFLLFSHGRVHFIDNRERWPWIAVSIGLILIAVGSSYYHLAPDNSRLVWDRLPMTIVFMSIVVALLCERINLLLGLCLWPVLLGIGLYSALHWQITDDLRFYIGVQIFTIVVILIMLLTPSAYTRSWDLLIVAMLYGFAILFDQFDHQVNMFNKGFISGHTLKHLAAALAGIWLLRMVAKRKIKSSAINRK